MPGADQLASDLTADLPLLDSHGPIALAVSGGSDSMALLVLALGVRNRKNIRVLTIDHGLRRGSDIEARQVGQWCRNLGVEHQLLTWQGEKPKTGIQAKARAARYQLLTDWCNAHGVTVLATGHTMDDQAETVVMRAKRTDSAKSLAGIWPEALLDGVRIVRPLLHLRREHLRKMLGQVGQAWFEDPSNNNTAFERVRIRMEMASDAIPELARLATRSRQATLAITAEATRWLATHADIQPTGLIVLPRTAFDTLATEVADAVLGWCISASGSGLAPDRGSLADLRQRISKVPGRRHTLAGALVGCRQHQLLIGREPGRIDAMDAVIPPSGRLIWDGRFVIRAPAGSRVRAAGNRCPRPVKTLPAFVLAGLPEVEHATGERFFPHWTKNSEASIMLSERFRI